MHASLLLLMLLIASPVFGAEVFFDTPSRDISTGEIFSVKVILDTRDVSVNAVEGSIVFPQDLLEVKDTAEENSVINFWVEKPHVTEPGILTFSGIAPGGFSGPNNPILTISLQVKQSGEAVLSVKGMRVLQNDGHGTTASTTVSDLTFSIQEGVATTPHESLAADTDPPEIFTPVIASSSVLFEGRNFLVFATNDKGSGIDHYEVREGKWGWFTKAQSPYLLKYQMLDKDIFVKAIDTAGNERIAVLAREPTASRYPWYVVFSILGILLISVVLKFIWSKSE